MARDNKHHRRRSRSRSRSRSHSPTPEKKRRRSRSRDREKTRHRDRRSRSRDKDRRDRSDRKERSDRRERDKKGSDNKERSSRSTKDRPNRSRSREKENDKGEEEQLPFDHTKLDKEEEQKRLEQEMQKRRERIERWRAERKKKELEATKKEGKASMLANLQLPMKKWSLEDDSDEEIPLANKDVKESEPKPDKEETIEPIAIVIEEEVDPLDAFMAEVQEEVKKVNKQETKTPKVSNGPGCPTGGVMIVTGIAKKKVQKQKGELIEQNQDGLEYSSEEEGENLHETAAGIANKQKRELAKTDHTTTDYLPFRKSFYVEVPEIAKMTMEQVEIYREELESVKVLLN